MQREGVVCEDVMVGWVKKDGARKWTYYKGEDEELETQVLKDFSIVLL
jgi:hypothetical protein